MARVSEAERQEFRKLLDRHRAVTILSHIRPDPDAIGTSLGLYAVLKKAGYRVEIANATRPLPRVLDFLEGFGRIKGKIDYDDSLVIACDCGSIDRLGFDVAGREMVVIDHHPSNTGFGTLNVVDPSAVSSSEVAFALLAPDFEIPPAGAEAFYAALLSDTRNFTLPSVTAETFALAQDLIARGVDPGAVAQQMLQRRSLASLRILGRAINSLRLYLEGKVAVMIVTREDLEATGAEETDLEGVADYGRSLATVRVAVLMVERPGGWKVSLRSKGEDVMSVALAFGGGGHRAAAGFEKADISGEALLEALLERINIEKEDIRS